ncbi:MAG: diacylglycerol kinase family lipid kinase [Planctomycetota bacterium]|nr:MAG: diacylglycerol kinase family lipid kinase [Planctomycetota bacterium]
MGKRTAIIYNPISGRGKSKRLSGKVARALEKSGHDALLSPTESTGDARRMAGEFAENGIDAVVAVGGDGTVSEIVCGLDGADIPVAICPAGTANVLALELGLPSAPEKIAELVTKGKVRRIDVGRIGKKRFVVAASAGVDAWVVHDLYNTRKGAITMATYTGHILRAMRTYRYPPMLVEIDGKPLGRSVGYVVVANTHRYGGPLRIARRGKCDDGLLDITIARGRSLRTALHYTAASVARMLPLLSGVKTYTGKHVSIKPEDDSEIPVQIDGDPGGTLPVTIEIIPGAAPMLVP